MKDVKFKVEYNQTGGRRRIICNPGPAQVVGEWQGYIAIATLEIAGVGCAISVSQYHREVDPSTNPFKADVVYLLTPCTMV